MGTANTVQLEPIQVETRELSRWEQKWERKECWGIFSFTGRWRKNSQWKALSSSLLEGRKETRREWKSWKSEQFLERGDQLKQFSIYGSKEGERGGGRGGGGGAEGGRGGGEVWIEFGKEESPGDFGKIGPLDSIVVLSHLEKGSRSLWESNESYGPVTSRNRHTRIIWSYNLSFLKPFWNHFMIPTLA